MNPRERPVGRERLAAAVALAAFAAAAAVAALAVLRSLPWVLAPVPVAALAAALGWKALGHRGTPRGSYAAASAACLVATVVGLVALTSAFPGLLLAVVLFVAGAAMAGPALSWIHAPRLRLVGRARRGVLIVNPRSGDGAAQRCGLVAAARDRGLRVVELDEGDDLGAVARRAIRSDTDCVGMAGGDGSLALVAGLAREAGVAFVCVPAGTRNHFALDLGLDRSDVVGALDAFGEAVERRVDLGVVDGRLFVNNVSIGAYGEIVAAEQYREEKVGTALEAIPDLIGPDAEPLDLRFTDGAGETHDTAVVLHVSNNAYELGPRLGLAGRPSLEDGLLGVVAVVQTPETGAPSVLQWQAPSFTVESSAALAAGVDGEAVELDVPARFELERAALRVRMPRQALGISPAARRPALTTRTVRRLWAVLLGRAPAEVRSESETPSIA